jgi:hypothetical protein
MSGTKKQPTVSVDKYTIHHDTYEWTVRVPMPSDSEPEGYKVMGHFYRLEGLLAWLYQRLLKDKTKSGQKTREYLESLKGHLDSAMGEIKVVADKVAKRDL